jgi:hypothetical protein
VCEDCDNKNKRAGFWWKSARAHFSLEVN